MLALLLVVVAAVVALAVAAAVIPGVVGDKLGDALAAINPFDSNRVDRTGPAVLQAITERAELKAASGYYEVIVDLDDGDGDHLPDFITGDKVIYVGKGDVEATVDLGGLDERRVVVSDDGTAVAITLPAPKMSEPRLDLEASRFAVSDKGLVTKLRGSDLEQEAQSEAVRRLRAAANANNTLADAAKNSARETLTSLLSELAYTSIEINFDDSCRRTTSRVAPRTT